MSYRYIDTSSGYDHSYENHSTTTASPMSSKGDDEAFFDYFIIVLYFFTSVIAMLGNSFVCYVIYRTPKFNSTTFTLLLNMAVSDLFSGLVIMLQWIFCSYYLIETYSPRLCVLNKSFQIMSYYISTYSMMFIAIDRYMLIKHPHTKGLKLNKYFACCLTWLVGGFFSSTTLFNMRINEYFGPKHLITCRIAFPVDGYLAFVLRKWRVALLIVSQFLIPLIVIIWLYAIIWNIIQSRTIVGHQADSLKRKQFSKNKKKLIKMLIFIVVSQILV